MPVSWWPSHWLGKCFGGGPKEATTTPRKQRDGNLVSLFRGASGTSLSADSEPRASPRDSLDASDPPNASPGESTVSSGFRHRPPREAPEGLEHLKRKLGFEAVEQSVPAVRRREHVKKAAWLEKSGA